MLITKVRNYRNKQAWADAIGSEEEIRDLEEMYSMKRAEFTIEHNVDFAYVQAWGEDPRNSFGGLDLVDMSGADLAALEPDGVYLFSRDFADMQFQPGDTVYRVNTRGLPLGLDAGRVNPDAGEVGFVSPVPISADRITKLAYESSE